MPSLPDTPTWRREAPRDSSPDDRSEISLDETTPTPAWKRKPKAWRNRTTLLAALIVFLLSIFFLVGALWRSRHHAAKKDPNITILKPQFFPEHNSERVRIRYGPFTAPSMSEDNGMKNFGQNVAQVPCTDCLVTWMQAGLTYEDGTEANADTGMWLHHTVFSNTNRSAIVCPNYHGDRFFASGNERTPIDICVSGTEKVGYYIAAGENIGFIAELMNMHDEPRAAYLTMTFEFIPGDGGGGFSKAQSLWLDIGGCRTSSLPAKKKAHFDYTSPEWMVPSSGGVSGKVTFVAGHLHDGGTRLEVVRNGRVVCVSRAEYGGCAGGVGMGVDGRIKEEEEEEEKEEKNGGEELSRRYGYHDDKKEDEEGGMPGMNMSSMHISHMSSCEDVGRVEKGDTWSVTAHYDTKLHEPMVNADGSLEPIMGIALVYVAGESQS